MPYYVRIARFMPRVEIVQRYNSTVRRLHIQGDNGKVYPYLVLNDTQVTQCRSQERLLQLLSMLNLCLEKDKVRLSALVRSQILYFKDSYYHAFSNRSFRPGQL